jgi:Major capsid protein N-terminus/Large eukaryotic DNA virus major capsid protein
MQLVAYGAQDIYLTGNPQITFFKVVYRRHTNFATESIEQTFNGTVGFGKRLSVTISRNGDLITDAFLEITLKRKVGGPVPYYPAEAFVKAVELEIGGQRIDKHYSDWFRMYDELFRKDDDKKGYRRLTDFGGYGEDDWPEGSVRRLYLPLVFFFNRNPGLALPLIALQYHEVKLHIDIEYAHVLETVGVDTAFEPSAMLWVDYVFLDTDERRRFAQTSHEYLIDQLQYTGDETVSPSDRAKASHNIRLNYNHPVKFLAFNFGNASTHGHYAGCSANAASEALAPLYEAKLQLNGHDRFSTRKGSYFNMVQPWQTLRSKPKAGVYLYSFALKPDEHQPSGTCNFSRIDNATLQITLKQASVPTLPDGSDDVANLISEDVTSNSVLALKSLRTYCINFNVLRIVSGMGGLALNVGHKNVARHPFGLRMSGKSLALPVGTVACAA